MNQRFTAFTGVLLLAAFVGLQSSSPAPDQGGALKATNVPPSPDKNSIVVPLSELGPWEASCDYFQPLPGVEDEGPRNRPGLPLDLTNEVEGQLGALDHKSTEKPQPIDPPRNNKPSARPRWCIPEHDPPEFLIATVPDPVNSHLALEFDRRMDAITWAATAAGYVNDQFWLPWDPADGSSKKSDDPAKVRTETMLAETRQNQPGLLIFRPTKTQSPTETKSSTKTQSPNDTQRPALFVFLVGETPTNGVSKEQFHNAVEYIRVITDEKKDLASLFSYQNSLRILGPSFSGSVHSILQVVNLFNCDRCFHAIPSSATGRAALNLLDGKRIYHHEVLHDDGVASVSFLCFARDSLQIDPKSVAILSESETQFGAIYVDETVRAGDDETPQNPCGPAVTKDVTHLVFPREIASLRNAYPDRPISLPGLASANRVQQEPGLSLPLHLWDKDRQIVLDSIPEFSGGQIPLSQEAVLYQIASTIRRKKIRLIEIRATNIYDTLFLSSFLRVSCPDTRLAVFNADLLLITATGTIPIDGMLSISTYPLIPLNQEWTNVGDDQLIWHFPDQASEATYNAFLALMSDSHSPMRVSLLDYRSPNPEDSTLPHAPLWISAVGRTGFVPVALLPTSNGGAPWWVESKSPEPVKSTQTETPTRSYYFPPAPSGSYLFMAGAILLFALVAHVFAVMQRYGPWGTYPQWWLENFNVEGPWERGQKLYLMIAASLLLFLLCSLICLPVWRYFFSPSARGFEGAEWLFLFTVSSLIVTGWLLCQAVQLHLEALSAELPYLTGLLVCVWTSTVAVFGVWFLFGVGGHADMRAPFFLYRTTELASGVSPLVPVLFLLLALYVWTLSHLRRIRYGEVRQPNIPTAELDGAFHFKLSEQAQQLHESLRSLTLDSQMFLVVLFTTITLIFLSRMPGHIAGIEPFVGSLCLFGNFSYFSLLVLFVLFLVVGLLFAVWARFIHCWYLLQRILIPLEHTMLRQAFDRLPKLYYSWAPLWHALSGRRSYVILARSKECLDRLLKEPGIDLVLSAVRAGEKESPENPSLSTLLNDFFEEEATGSLNLGGPLLAVQDRMRTIAGQLITALLPYWRKKGSSETLEDIAAKAKEKDPPKISVQAVLAEEFVALRFMILIRYVSLQMRNQLFFIVAGFILTVLALRSYPFLASRAIGWTLTLIFATLATGVVFVLAQMSKDAILSRISDTKPGEVSGDFYVRVLSFGALPVLTLLASQFPSISRFLFSWVQPGIEALH